MVKYKITLDRAWIKKVYTDRETDQFVVFGHRREAKMSDCVCYFDSFAEAKAHLLRTAEAKRDLFMRYVNEYKQIIDEASKLNEDD